MKVAWKDLEGEIADARPAWRHNPLRSVSHQAASVFALCLAIVAMVVLAFFANKFTDRACGDDSCWGSDSQSK